MSEKEEESPTSPGPDQIYRMYLSRGQIMIQQCDSCSGHFFPPRLMCPNCGSAATTWREASGRGEIYSCSVVRRKPERGGDYSIVLVDLDEGVRMMSQVLDIAPDKVEIGARVSLGISQLGEEHAVTLHVASDAGGPK